MIQIKIQEIAAQFDIKNAYQLQNFTGYSPAMAARIWKGEWIGINVKTLNTLCNLFKCTPNDVLCFTPDADEDQ